MEKTKWNELSYRDRVELIESSTTEMMGTVKMLMALTKSMLSQKESGLPESTDNIEIEIVKCLQLISIQSTNLSTKISQSFMLGSDTNISTEPIRFNLSEMAYANRIEFYEKTMNEILFSEKLLFVYLKSLKTIHDDKPKLVGYVEQGFKDRLVELNRTVQAAIKTIFI